MDSSLIRVPFRALFIRVPYYTGDPTRDPNLGLGVGGSRMLRRAVFQRLVRQASSPARSSGSASSGPRPELPGQ